MGNCHMAKIMVGCIVVTWMEHKEATTAIMVGSCIPLLLFEPGPLRIPSTTFKAKGVRSGAKQLKKLKALTMKQD